MLGLEHPDTLTRITNLALTYWNQGRWKEAIQLMSEVVQYRREKIGSDHPDTLQSIRTIDEWRAEQD